MNTLHINLTGLRSNFRPYLVIDGKNIPYKRNATGSYDAVYTTDKDSANNYSKLAESKLAELNKLTTTLSLTMLGDYRMRKGVIMPINNVLFNIQGDFLIKSSRHSISDTKEFVTVNLEKYDRKKLG